MMDLDWRRHARRLRNRFLPTLGALELSGVTGRVHRADAMLYDTSPESVAKVGYDAMLRGKLVAINERSLSFLLNWVVPFLPRRRVLKMSRKAMEN